MGRKRGGASGANASVADAEKRGGAVNNKPKEVPSTVPSSKKGAPNKKGNGVSTVKNRGNSESLSVIGLVLGLVQIAVLGVGGLTTVLFILAAALPELWVMYPPRLQLIMVDLMLSATTAYTVLIEHNEYWLDALSAMQPDSQNDTSVWLESWVKPHLNDLPKPPTWERPELLYLNWNHGPVYNKTKDDKPYRSVVSNVLTPDECSVLRSAFDSHPQDYKSQDYDGSLGEEFKSVPIPKFDQEVLSNGDDSDPTAIKRLNMVGDTVRKVRDAVSAYFNAPDILIEFVDLTKRTGPTNHTLMGHLRHRLSAGHGTHADQCLPYWKLNMTNDLVHRSEDYHCDFAMSEDTNCCQQRTHAAVLYLNEPTEMHGGDFYFVDRRDIPPEEETKASFAGEGTQEEVLSSSLRVPPRCGELSMFTADLRNMHGTYPVSHGARYALTFWFTNLIDFLPLPMSFERAQRGVKNVQSACRAALKKSSFAAPLSLTKATDKVDTKKIFLHQDICKQWIADLVVDVESQIEVGAGGTKGRDTVTEQPSDGGLEPESV